MKDIILKLLDTGGALRVRAGLAFALTGGGIAFLLTEQSMPPQEYNLIWTAAVSFYFSTRAANSGP